MASPQLRLSTATVGPVFIATGQNGASQSVTVSNTGDGSLALTLAANVPWITPTLTGSGSIQIALNTSSLARGNYTGVVTASDPNAVDAPQTIAVVVQIGSAVPDSLDLYLPPGGTTTSSFVTSHALSIGVTNPSGGVALSILLNGGGSFVTALSYTYNLTASAPVGAADTDYPGSLQISGSTFAGDNKTVPVTAHVTSLPIAAWSGAKLIAVQGLGKATAQVGFSNSGMGALALSGATPSAAWLTATVQGTTLSLSADPAGMSPGTYSATVSVASNARNSPSTVNVELDVRAAGPPVTYFGGVLDNALFKPGDPLAPGGIAAVFGEQFTNLAPVVVQAVPLNTSMDGATVYVNGLATPSFYVSPGQIDFQIPYETAPGQALVRVDQGTQRGNTVSVNIEAAVPRLLQFASGYAIATFTDNVTFPMPTTPGIPSHAAKAGVDTLVFYALGLGQTSPAAADGQAAPAGQIHSAEVIFGAGALPGSGFYATPVYAGLSPGSVGLYQINVTVPANCPPGNAVAVRLGMDGGVVSNSVNIAVQ